MRMMAKTLPLSNAGEATKLSSWLKPLNYPSG